MTQLDRKLAALPTLSSAELKDEWRRFTKSPLPKISPSLLRLALAYKLQAQALGGVSRTTQAKLDQIARAKTQTAGTTPGMRLVREWNGKAHVVTIDDNRVIHWNNRQWNSLSEVAREITGTRWSGPAFFGLKTKRAAA